MALSAAALVLGATIAAGPVQAAKALEDRKWLEVTTSNFTIRSTLGKSDTSNMARHAELLRAVVLLMTTSGSVDPAIPTAIYAVPGKDYEKLVDLENTAGIYLPDSRQNFILIKDGAWIDQTATIKHEYVHQVTLGLSGADFPKWYIEGIAEYFEATEIKRGKFRVGVPADNHAYRLSNGPWMPADVFLDSANFGALEPKLRSLFYSQSWALVHYLMHAEDKPVSLAEGFERYTAERELGKTEYEAFEIAFQIDAEAMPEMLKRYIRRECCQYVWVDADELLPDFEPNVEKIPQSEISLGLGQLARRLGKYDASRKWLDIAAGDTETRAMALAYSASLESIDGDIDLANRLIEEASALAPGDPFVHTEIADIKLRRAKKIEDSAERKNLVREAQTSLVTAWRLDKTIPLVYSLTGQAYMLLGMDYDRAIELLEQAVILAPSNLEFRFYLAHAYARGNRYEDASWMANSLVNWSHGAGGFKDNLQELISVLEEDDAGESGED